eukprot:scaffold36221_cov71-Cyclotella_meneghiniana.AAC.1
MSPWRMLVCIDPMADFVHPKAIVFGMGFYSGYLFGGGASAGKRGGIISSEAHQHVADVK